MNTHKAPTILVVEDEHQQRDVLSMLLESVGYNVVSVESAEEGLVQLEKHTPELIVTDVKLTVMDGFSFFERVREDSTKRNLPFVFITGYNDPQAIEKAKSLGAVAYVTKPYDLEELLNIIKELLPLSVKG